MSAVKLGCAAVALLLLSVGAFFVTAGAVSTRAIAFQEQSTGTAAPAADPAAKPATPLAAPDSGAKPGSSGTEVRIPGLGKLGDLPKMDFGLELLYGAADGKQAEPQQRDEGRDDLTIRGSVKHKF